MGSGSERRGSADSGASSHALLSHVGEETDPLLIRYSVNLEEEPTFKEVEFFQVAFIQFLSAFANSAFLATTFLYLDNEFGVEDASLLAGVSLAGYAVAQGVGGLLVGWLADRYSIRTVLLLTQTVDVLANAGYSMAQTVPGLIAARTLSGVASANLVVGYGFISAAAPPAARGEKLGTYQATASFGYLLGPLITLGIGYADVRVGKYLVIDEYTSPGWTCALLNLMSLVMLVFFFQQRATLRELRDARQIGVRMTAIAGEVSVPLLAACCVLHFCNWMAVGVVRTTVAPHLADSYKGFGATEVSIAMSLIAVECGIAFRIVGRLSKRVPPIRLLWIAFAFSMAAHVALLQVLDPRNLPLWRYSLGLALFFTSYCLFTVLVPMLYARLGASLDQGAHMARLSAVMSIALGASPLLAGAVYEYFGGFEASLVSLGFMLVALGTFVAVDRRKLAGTLR